ncbi:MAG: NUDIX hydrolase [Chromatiales bacterium]|jgi:8-oxo-dGTP pyrophosphatase MutT (NUDIX family)|nr:NUDIX hydrolase [Chromatiales bacterium]
MNDSSTPLAPPIDAATVVVARDTDDGIELLMLLKNSKIHFGGMWVFPGGRVDDEDRVDADEMEGFRRAAVREAREEAGLELGEADFAHVSHWLPPPIRQKRFSTHFFLARAPLSIEEISIDGGEITDHTWTSAERALQRRHIGEIEIVTPTFVTLDWIRRFDNLDAAFASIDAPMCYHTHITQTPQGAIAFYAGDTAYDSLDPTQPGPRRRANMLETGWWWEEHDGEGNGPWTKPVGF